MIFNDFTLATVIVFMVCAVVPMIKADLTPKELEDKINNIEKIAQNIETSTGVCSDIKDIVSRPSMQVFGTEYQVGDAGTSFIQLLSDERQAINDAVCYIDSYYPNKTIFWEDAPLTYQTASDGLYYKDFTAPNIIGLYMLSSTCYTPANAFFDDFNDYSNLENYENVTIEGGEIKLLDDTGALCSGSADVCSTFVSNVSCVAQQGCGWGTETAGANITGIIDTFEFETTTGKTPTSIKVSDSAGGIIYAVFYEGLQGDGFVSTYEILNNGTIVNNLIDTFEFDTTAGITPSALKYSDNIYLLGYQGAGGDGFAKTINITDNGTIIETLDTFEIDETDLNEPNLFWINEGNGLAGFTSSQFATDGVLGTGNVSNNGTINRISRFVFNETQANFVDSINVSNNVVLVVYQADVGGDNFGGHLQTIYVLNNGTVNHTIDLKVLDATQGDQPSITLLNNDLYAITYKGSGGFGKIATYNVYTNGTISLKLDSINYDTAGEFPHTIRITDEILGIVHQDGSGGGEFLLMSIANNGTINQTIQSNLTFTNIVERAEISHFKDDIYLITYQGEGDDGYVQTVEIIVSAGGDVCSGTATACSLLNSSEPTCTNQLSCAYTPPTTYTNGWIQSTPLNLSGYSWDTYSSTYSDNSGTTTFSILNNSNSTLCSSLGSILSCANNQTPIKFYATLSRLNSSDTSPTIDLWGVTWLINGTVREVKGAGELHITNYVNEINANIDNVSTDVWNYNGTISNNILSQFATAIWNLFNSTYNFINLIVEGVWTRADRNLTYYEPTSNLTAEGVWNSPSRNLTYTPSYPTPNNLSAQDVWVYGTRDLTYYETSNITVNGTDIAQQVWNYEGTINDDILNQIADKIECYITKLFAQEDEKWGIDIPIC